MKRKPNTFTKEFKDEAIKLVKEQGYTQTEVAKRLGINSKNISRWVQESMADSAKTRNTITPEQQELQELGNEVKRLKLEREILKKATVNSMGHCNT